jgi:hypothetical protein
MNASYLRILLATLICSLSFCLHASQKITSVDFVQVIDNNKQEALYYYQNNWQHYRQLAKAKGFIEDFMLLETEATEQAPFHFMLITTYPNQEAYDKREENFRPLMETRDGLKLWLCSH